MPQSNIFVTVRSMGFELPEGLRLFSNISFTINQGRYGLVGANGIGKSTLAKLLQGTLTPTEGDIIREAPILYLCQQEERNRQFVSEYLSPLWEVGSSTIQVWLPLVENIAPDRCLLNLSGGEWMRLRLAKSLIAENHVLILDEPTNNLDRDAREMIHKFIKDYQGSLVIISHDRELLRDVDTILELSNQGVSIYGGNFEFYHQQKVQENKLAEARLERARKKKRKLEKEFNEKIESQEKRMRRGEKQAARGGMPKILLGGLKRQAEKTQGRIHFNEEIRVENVRQEMNALYKKIKQETYLGLELPDCIVAEGKIIFDLKDLNIRFGEEPFLWKNPLNLQMKGPRRWALAGANGTGKTTLIKLLLGQSLPELRFVGQCYKAEVPVAYLDQEYSILNLQESVIENVRSSTKKDLKDIRNSLARFQFTQEKVHQWPETLSGGEKLKAALAKIFLRDPIPQLLILDEPTNNLDLGSLEVLEGALKDYGGALLVVSHDIAFLDNCGIEEVHVLQPCKP